MVLRFGNNRPLLGQIVQNEVFILRWRLPDDFLENTGKIAKILKIELIAYFSNIF